MFIPLEGQGVVSIRRVVAMIRHGDETAVYLNDGTILATGFTRRRWVKIQRFQQRGKENALALRRRMGGNRT